MSKPYKRKGSPKFVQLFRWLTRSDAWRACSPVERAAYLELKERYNGNNNGRVGLSVRDLADALLSSKDTASRALKGLQAKGFITVMKRSAFSVKNRTSTEYGLTEYACDITGNLATKEFMKWRPEKNQQSDQKDTQSDRKDSVAAKMLDNATLSPTGRTVKPRSCNSQSDRKDTYRSTTRGNAA